MLFGCCCQGCSIASDPFDRSDGTDITTGSSCGWTEVGPFSLVSDQLQADDIDSYALCNTQAAAGTIEVRAEVDMIGNADGDELRLVLKCKDSTVQDLWYAQLTIGASGTLKIFKVVGGTTTELASVACATTAGNTYHVQFCYGGGAVRAVETVTSFGVNYTTATTINDQHIAGVGTGSLSIEPQFDNFVYEYGYNASTKPTCSNCGCAFDENICIGDLPTQFDITLPDDWSASGNCDNCDFGGLTYTVTNNTTTTGVCAPVGSPTDLVYTYTATQCNAVTPASVPIKLHVVLRVACFSGTVVMRVDVELHGILGHCDSWSWFNYHLGEHDCSKPISATLGGSFPEAPTPNCAFTDAGPVLIQAH